jgi:hypothetical protein
LSGGGGTGGSGGSRDTGDPSSAFSTGLAGDGVLGELSATDAEQACVAAEEFLYGPDWQTGELELGCRVAAIRSITPTSDEEARQLCQQSVDDCVAYPSEDPADCSVPLGTECTATVAAYEACVNDAKSVFDSVPSCSGIALETTVDLTTFTPDSCVTMGSLCPAFGGGD